MNVSQKRLAVGGLIVALVLYAIWSVVRTAAVADRLRQDVGDLVTLKKQLNDIQRFSQTPAVAALEVESPDQIVNRIDAAVRRAGLNENALANQTPSQPQRIDGSDFTLRRVDIQLNAATVPQIVAFCEALKDESTGSVVRDLQLYEPRRVGGRETWKSQLTLTQVIFSPKSDS